MSELQGMTVGNNKLSETYKCELHYMQVNACTREERKMVCIAQKISFLFVLRQSDI